MIAYVLLEDGTRFDGDACGAPGRGHGEVVFNTGDVRLPGVGHRPLATRASSSPSPTRTSATTASAQQAMESDRVHARAAIMREAINREDAPGAEGGWLDWLRDCGVPAITGVDTRALVRHIRDAGAMRGGVFPAEMAEAEARALIAAEPPMAGLDLAREVTPAEPDRSGTAATARGSPRSTPASSPRSCATCASAARRVELHPCTTTAEELLARDPDAFFLANGPGDPAALGYIVDTVRGLVGSSPVFGICLGHQLLCRAVGLDTFKLPFGHRGANHPVKDLTTGRIEITAPEPRLRRPRPRRRAHDRGRRAGALGDRLRRRRADPSEPLRPHGRGARAARRHGRHGAVPPRGRPRPHDSLYLFDRFLDAIAAAMPRRDDIEQILLLGSGPIVIGQAAEFDYSGTQACKVLKDEGYEVILVNSNPATIMTDPEFADATYIEPLLPGPVPR